MIDRQITRRRALSIFGAVAGTALVGASQRKTAAEWRGTALGANARIVLQGFSRKEAQQAIAISVAEIERLENIFSLYREESEICRLNEAGHLTNASMDMRQLLFLCRKMHDLTEGLFDPTVQRLWRFLAEWFNENPAHETPPRETLSALTAGIGMEKISIHEGTVSLAPGSQITLNGIAQGYITDRVADLLKTRGFSHILLDLGEVYALGGKRDGTPWQVKIRENGLLLPAKNIAVATSAGSALPMGGKGQSHLLDPLTGDSPRHWDAITVEYTSAAIADALSTGLYAASSDTLLRIASHLSTARVWATDRAGHTTLFPSRG